MGKRQRNRDRDRAAVQPDVDALVAEIESRGWTVEFPEYCEDAETPGLLGHKQGVTVFSRKVVKVRRDLDAKRIVAVLAHELEHVDGVHHATDHPALDLYCGERVNGFGDPLPRVRR